MKLNKRESLEIDLYIYGDSVYDKAGIQDLWERWGFQTGTVGCPYGGKCSSLVGICPGETLVHVTGRRVQDSFSTIVHNKKKKPGNYPQSP